MLHEKSFERLRKFRVGDLRLLFFVDPGQVTYFGHTYQGILFLVDIRPRKEAY